LSPAAARPGRGARTNPGGPLPAARSLLLCARQLGGASPSTLCYSDRRQHHTPTREPPNRPGGLHDTLGAQRGALSPFTHIRRWSIPGSTTVLSTPHAVLARWACQNICIYIRTIQDAEHGDADWKSGSPLRGGRVQGNLAHKKQRQPRTLRQAYAYGPRAVLGGRAVFDERGAPGGTVNTSRSVGTLGGSVGLPVPTRRSTTLPSKVNLPYAINFRALCGASLVT
jgi:hypothetical protein